MINKTVYTTILLILLTCSTSAPSYAVQNTSLSKMLVKFQGNEFNLIIAKPNLVGVTQRKKKTRKAIMNGFEREVKNIRRLIMSRNLNVNMKVPNPKKSDTPQYSQIDNKVYAKLAELVQVETDLHSNILERLNLMQSSSTSEKSKSVSSDEINADDIEFDPDKMFETTVDIGEVNSMNLSPEAIFNTIFLEVGELYEGAEIDTINKVRVPFRIKAGNIAKKPVHSVFGVAFFPTTYGAIKQMKMYIFLFVLNTETQGSNIAFKEIPNFRWDRNELYISAATSKVLRQIISEVLGEPVR